MKFLHLLAPVAAALLIACQPAAEESAPVSDPEPAEETSTLNVDSVVETIAAYREEVETAMLEDEEFLRTEIPTADLRPQIAQKWSTIHVYTDEGRVVRVKTYPHEGISERTEEFYYDLTTTDLRLAVIEDEGLQEDGEAEATDSKVYYFFDGELIHEVNASGEAETSIRESDGERLMQEAAEYLEIAAAATEG